MTTDQFWSTYARLQKIVSSATRITPKTIALEDALTELLAKMDTFIQPNNAADINLAINRSLNACSWRERSHVRLRARYCCSISPQVSPETASVAVVEIRELRDRLTPQEWALLLSVAAGFSYDELSTTIDSAARLRVKVYRARKKVIASSQ